MALEEQHYVALPKLYGQPAYARPPRPVLAREHGIDPDDLPIEAHQTDEERAIASELRQLGYGALPMFGRVEPATTAAQLQARPFNLRALAGRLVGGRS